MGIFKKIFNKSKKEEEKKEECWYNNAHEQGQIPSASPLEAPCSQNSYLYSTAKQAAKKQ